MLSVGGCSCTPLTRNAHWPAVCAAWVQPGRKVKLLPVAGLINTPVALSIVAGEVLIAFGTPGVRLIAPICCQAAGLLAFHSPVRLDTKMGSWCRYSSETNPL